MGLGRRNARKHDTNGVRVQSSMDVEPVTGYQVGQKVVTLDGFPGTIVRIEDADLRGNDNFHVILDNGLGGGEYSSSQINPVTASKSQFLAHLASEDYPELEEILVERPDIAINTKMGSFRVQAIDCPVCNDEIDQTTDSGELMCPTCGYNPDEKKGEHLREFNLYHEGLPYSLNSLKTACAWCGCELGIESEHSKICPDCGKKVKEHKNELSNTATFSKVAGFDEAISHLAEEYEPHWRKYQDAIDYADDNYEPYSDEWNKATWDAEREHEPHSKRYWNALAMTHAAYGRDIKSTGAVNQDDPNMVVGGEKPVSEKHKGGATCPYCKYWSQNYFAGMICPICGHSMVSGNDVANQVHDPSDFTEADQDGGDEDSGSDDSSDDSSDSSDGGDSGGDSGGMSSTSSFNADNIIAEAALDPDFAFHVTAAWSDVRAKAKRIRSEGGVHIKMSSDGYVYADVRGDHNVYETGIQSLPGKHSVSNWTCGCKWGAYHWGAPDDNSRFAGRMCSHALAVQFEAQSRGMFGKDILEDTKKPKWVPRRVVVKWDINGGENVRRKASLSVFEGSVADHIAMLGDEDGYYTLLALTGSVNTPFGEVIVEQKQPIPGGTKKRNPAENPASVGFASAPDPGGWGDMIRSNEGVVLGSVHSSWNDEFLFEAELDSEATLNEEPEAALPRTDGSEATLHEEPEAALPSTDGNYVTRHSNPELATLPQKRTDGKDVGRLMANSNSTEEEDGKSSPLTPDKQDLVTTGSVNDIVAQFQATASHLDGENAGPAVGDSDIAKAAKQYLEKTSMKVFSPAEQSAIINEGQHVRAANYDRLDIEGTHYEQVEAALRDEEDTDALWF